MHARCPDLAGIPAVYPISADGQLLPGRPFGASVSGRGITFPGNGDWSSQRLGSNVE